jgi:hypothetical protein
MSWRLRENEIACRNHNFELKQFKESFRAKTCALYVNHFFMEKLQLTGRNLGRVFNSRSG